MDLLPNPLSSVLTKCTKITLTLSLKTTCEEGPLVHFGTDDDAVAAAEDYYYYYYYY